MTIRIGSSLASFSKPVDRHMPPGYRDEIPFEEKLRRAKEVEGLDGIALHYPLNFEDPVEIRELLDRYGLTLCVLTMGIWGERHWKMGSFTSTDPAIRRQAVERGKRSLDVAAELDVDEVLLWPAEDGFEYPFQANYSRAWGYLVEGITEVAEHRQDITIGIEYKPKEPRARCYVDSAAKAVLLCESVGLPNVGVTVDLGHALNAGENPGQSVALCAKYDRLCQIHVNDNYGDWDWDMLVGQINFWTTLEFFYWTNQVNFDDWYLTDIQPVRENGEKALAQCIRNTRRFAALGARLSETQLKAMQETADPLVINDLLWQEIIKL